MTDLKTLRLANTQELHATTYALYEAVVHELSNDGIQHLAERVLKLLSQRRGLDIVDADCKTCHHIMREVGQEPCWSCLDESGRWTNWSAV